LRSLTAEQRALFDPHQAGSTLPSAAIMGYINPLVEGCIQQYLPGIGTERRVVYSDGELSGHTLPPAFFSRSGCVAGLG
jgi:hypothetical protein